MSIESNIILAFPNMMEIADPERYFSEQQNPMELEGNINLLEYIPAYMLRCVRNPEPPLVEDHTLNALAEYGRSKDPTNSYLNFKYLCNNAQKEVVVQFLKYYSSNPLYSNSTQIKRALKNW